MRLKVLLLSGLFLPSIALAATDHAFDFRGQIPGRWPVQGWTSAVSQSDGLHISTSAAGAMTTMLTEKTNAQTLVITTLSPKATDALFLWHPLGQSPQMVQMPFVIPASTTPTQTSIDLSRYSQWDPKTDSIGIALPAGSQVTLQSISLVHYNVFERVWTMVKSLGTFDTFGTYSINFLWGPLVAFTPVELHHLYEGQPPYSWSVMRIVYALIALAIIAWWLVRWNGRPRRARRILITTIAILWIFLDLRMSAEIMSYATSGLNTFVLHSETSFEKKLENSYRTTLQHLLEENKAWFTQESEYVVVSDLPILGNARYATLPSLPIPSSATDAISHTHWFVFEDATVTIDAEGHLVKKGVVLSSPGSVVKQFDKSTFLFLTH